MAGNKGRTDHIEQQSGQLSNSRSLSAFHTYVHITVSTAESAEASLRCNLRGFCVCACSKENSSVRALYAPSCSQKHGYFKLKTEPYNIAYFMCA